MMPISTFSADHTTKLGADIATSLSNVKADAELLQSLVGLENVPQLENLYAALNAWRFSVAAVGQMKAGKSSFLNAIIHAPNLLPSDVNPWTTVVTKLRFGHPDDQTAGGRFNFFTEGDWTKIIERSDAGNEHLKDLVASFDETVLQDQFKNMRGRAQNKLGNLYPLLLGNSHNYDAMTQSILERYVAAGVDTTGAATGKFTRAGYYADITKYAEVFFPQNIFDIPTVVIDTPGVNDPYMVRDEFTCQTLGEANVYMMFMSVHQALTEFDMNFIELLGAQIDKRIIVMINRVDELDDFVTNAKIVRQDVEKRLYEAGFKKHIQAVVIGSASWAQAARNPDELDASLPMDDIRKMVTSLYKVETADDRICLEYASGLRMAEQAMETSMTTVTGTSHLNRVTAGLKQCLGHAQNLLDTRIRDHQSLLTQTDTQAALTAHVSLMERRLSTAQTGKAQFEKTSAQLTQQIDETFENIIRDSNREFTVSLRDLMTRECETLTTSLYDNSNAAETDLDLVGIRAQIVKFAEAFFDAKQSRVDSEHTTLRRALAKLTQPTWAQARPVDTKFEPQKLAFTPILPKLSDELKIAVSDRNRVMFWKKNKLTREAFLEKLELTLNREMAATISVVQRYTTDILVTKHAEYRQENTNELDAATAIMDSTIASLSAALAMANDTGALDANTPKQLTDRIKILKDNLKSIEKIAQKYA